ncbi:MAG TPA: hypothetical protein VEA16_06300 [Vicinamibacterales bacterium]|nr:hypothetical protein [Vicinamibacterales bacterium]
MSDATAVIVSSEVHRYFLSELDRRIFEERAQWSFLSEPARDGYIRLFNRNADTTLHVRNLGPCAYMHGWIVECDEVPPYFANVLKPFVVEWS